MMNPKITVLRNAIPILFVIALLPASLTAQGKRVWVLRAPGEMVEYDAAAFAARQTVKVPGEAVTSPQSLAVNHAGQMLFAPSVNLPLAEGDLAAERKIWFWDGRSASTISREVERTTATAGSNLAITESAATPFLSADGTRLYWFAEKARRLQRDGVDLSTKTSWQSWTTDLTGSGRQDVASSSMPECACPTGACEETCAYGDVWVPDEGVGEFFMLAHFVAGKTQPLYKSTSVYRDEGGKWTGTAIDPPLHRLLDAANADATLEAIPDTGCCGWSNQSDDQTLLHLNGKTLTIFDELAAYRNPDYDVTFYTENGKLSPNLSAVAFTVVATAKANQPIQLAEQGQGNPEESQRIRKALADLPAVEVKSAADTPRRIAFLPHADLVGWLNDKEILIVEGHLLVAYNLTTAVHRKSNIRVEDAAHVFLR